MDEKEFALRLSQLRQQKGVSAREMSLAMGQSHAYINNIETGKTLPSLNGLFYICEYLNITMSEFFDTGTQSPAALKDLIEDLKKLDAAQIATISDLVRTILGKK